MRAEAQQSQTAEQAIRAAHVILANCGVTMSANRVTRLVRRFEAQVARNGWTFFEFLANAAQLTADERRRALANSDIVRVITYMDITGETAAWNVDRERQRAGDTNRTNPPQSTARQRRGFPDQ